MVAVLSGATAGREPPSARPEPASCGPAESRISDRHLLVGIVGRDAAPIFAIGGFEWKRDLPINAGVRGENGSALYG